MTVDRMEVKMNLVIGLPFLLAWLGIGSFFATKIWRIEKAAGQIETVDDYMANFVLWCTATGLGPASFVLYNLVKK